MNDSKSVTGRLTREHYGGYEIAPSNGRGGKAGTGHNKTATIQVREPVRPGEYLLKAQFRYDVASSAAKANAHAKARAWIDAQRLADKLIIAFVQGAQYWEHIRTGCTLWSDDRNMMERAAIERLAAGTLGRRGKN